MKQRKAGGANETNDLHTFAVIDQEEQVVISWRRSRNGATLIAGWALARNGDQTRAPQLRDWRRGTTSRFIVVKTSIDRVLEQHIMLYGTSGLDYQLDDKTGFTRIWKPE